jgi:Ser/Thr protein kinase RdoA (MazF antagonist)
MSMTASGVRTRTGRRVSDSLPELTELANALDDHRVILGARSWPTPKEGPVICHSDVRLENFVFRDGAAVGLLNLDFAAPGRAVWDLARFAVMCVPLDDHADAARLGWLLGDRPTRLRVVADAHGPKSQGRVA